MVVSNTIIFIYQNKHQNENTLDYQFQNIRDQPDSSMTEIEHTSIKIEHESDRNQTPSQQQSKLSVEEGHQSKDYSKEELGLILAQSQKEEERRVNVDYVQKGYSKTAIVKRINFPTFNDIHKSIKVLKNSFPTTFTDDLIDYIIGRAIEKHRYIPCEQLQPPRQIKNNNINSQINCSPPSKPNIEQEQNSQIQYLQQKFNQATQINNKDDQMFRVRVIVCASFCQKLRNYTAFKQQLSNSGLFAQIPQVKYNSIVDQMILQAEESLRNSVALQDNNNIGPPTQYQKMRLIELFNTCTVNFSYSVCMLIFKLLRGLYSLESKLITAQQSTKLYKALMKGVKGNVDKIKMPQNRTSKKEIFNRPNQKHDRPIKSKRKVLDFRTKKARMQGIDYLKDTRKKKIVHKLDAHWSEELQAQMIELYKDRYHFSYIRNYLQSIYPHQSQIFTVNSVRSKMFKTLRVGIRKLYYYIANFGKELPELIKLDDERVKTLIYSQHTLDLRISVLNIYTLQQYDEQVLQKTLGVINDFFNRMQDSQRLKKYRSKPIKDDFRTTKTKLRNGEYQPTYFYRNRQSKENKSQLEK